MNWRDTWVLYRRELRSALRERSVVVNSVLMPVLLYPVLLWVEFTALVFVIGLSEGFTSRVAVLDPPPAHTALSDSHAADGRIDVSGDSWTIAGALAALSVRDLDAVVVFEPPAPAGAALPGNFQVRVHYDRAVDRSRRALERVEDDVDTYRAGWLDDQATALSIAAADRTQFRIAGANVSSEEDMGAVILGMMLPLFLVLSVALGCLVPSIDSTAGERERATWETLMTTGASRLSIVTSKYLYVASVGAVAGVLNVSAMFVAIGPAMAPLEQMMGEGDAFRFRFSATAMIVMLLGAVVLALFFAAAMMILAAFARSFKDGQAMVTPVFYLALLPLVLGQQTDQSLTPTIALIPVANVAMMVRDAIRGVFLWPLILETLAVGVALVVACLLLARAILRFEDFLIGSFGGSFWRFVKDRLASRGRPRHGLSGGDR